MSGRREIYVVPVPNGWAIQIDGERVAWFATKAKAVQILVRALQNVEQEDRAMSGATVAPFDAGLFAVH